MKDESSVKISGWEPGRSVGGGKFPKLEKLISGGQTGADRAALNVAIRHGLVDGFRREL